MKQILLHVTHKIN